MVCITDRRGTVATSRAKTSHSNRPGCPVSRQFPGIGSAAKYICRTATSFLPTLYTFPALPHYCFFQARTPVQKTWVWLLFGNEKTAKNQVILGVAAAEMAGNSRVIEVREEYPLV